MTKPSEVSVKDLEGLSFGVEGNRKKSILWKCIKIFAGFTLLGIAITFFFLFVVTPIIFMLSIEVQRLTMFTNIFLANKQSSFEENLKPGMRNFYITVHSKDINDLISIGVYHVLPKPIIKESIEDPNFNYDKSLKESNFSVILYFHGSGEDRIDSTPKYFVLNKFFHVIAFDYRDYGDSSKASLSEESVAEDSVQIYKWVRKKTNADIYFWGHSLGTSLSTSTIVKLKEDNVVPMGLILEAPFTSMKEEIPHHPYGKIFSWLPWFKVTILDPLTKNGFLFETDKNIQFVDCPIMILHAEDDSIIPYTLGKKLYEIILLSKGESNVIYHQFDGKFHYDHFFIYEDIHLPQHIDNFIGLCNNKSEVSYEFIDPDALVKNK